MYLRISLLILFILISGCVVNPIPYKKGEVINFSEKEAYVIVGTRGSAHLIDARGSGKTYQFWDGSEILNDVHIYNLPVGGTFKLNSAHIALRSARFDGKVIELKTPGIYYYGTLHTGIKNYNYTLWYDPEPNDAILQRVLNKYGRQQLAKIKTVGFTWP